jgi:hypothetical protein
MALTGMSDFCGFLAAFVILPNECCLLKVFIATHRKNDCFVR